MKKYLLFFLISLSIYLARSTISGQGVFGDGNAYYSYAHTLTFKGSLDFRQIYNHLSYFPGKKYQFNRAFWRQQPTSTGMLPNQWLIGPALTWLPLMFTFRTITFLLNLPISPLSLIWEQIAGISGILSAITGLYLLERTLLHHYSPRISSITVYILFFATHLFFYIAFEPVLSHSSIFFLVCLLLFLLHHQQTNRLQSWFLWGFLLGLISINRPSGFTFIPLLLLPASQLASHRSRALSLTTSAAAFILGITPQLLVQHTLFGSFFSQPYLTGYHGQAIFSFRFLLPALFSAERGLFIWTPILILALPGLYRFLARNRKFFPILIVLLLHLFFVGSWNGVISAGFGNRFFIEVLPLLAFGLATFFSTLKSRTTLTILTLSIIWNFALLTQFFLDKPRLVDLHGLTYTNLITGQITTPLKFIQSFSHNDLPTLIRDQILD